MPKDTFADYGEELAAQRALWQRKASLRALYHRWYARIVRQLAPNRPTVEIGSGCGNFKAFLPETVATDVYPCGDWIDRIVDARQLPFAKDEVGNFVLIDCLHHLPRPLKFLRQAADALQPGGRIVIFEPAATPWANFVWKRFHHEPSDLTADLFAADAQPEPENEGFLYSNMATATLLFLRGGQRLHERLPQLRLVHVELSDCLVYPATGGFSYLNFVPAALLPPLHAAEGALLKVLPKKLLAMRLLAVLEKPDQGRLA